MAFIDEIYVRSRVAVELIQAAHLTTAHTQFIFGVLIAVFPVTMIISGKMEKKYGPKLIAYLSAVFFLFGYGIAGFSKGDFVILLLSMGVLTGIGTGMGYLVSLTVPVQWFPQRKGFVTGIATAGFGIGALIFSFLAEAILRSGYTVFELFLIIGLAYSVIIFLVSAAFGHTRIDDLTVPVLSSAFIRHAMFRKLVIGIFLGTFAGLMLIGSLKLIGSQSRIDNHVLNIGVSLFAVFNFSGRLFWGYISDLIGAPVSIFLALTIQAMPLR